MAVNVNVGIPDPIQFALTTGKNKTPISAAPLTREKLELLDRKTLAVLNTVDSSVDANVFFTLRTQQTVKGVLVYLLEMELHDAALSLVVQEDLIARLTLYDGSNPLGLPWKQFALNSR
jgi:hypothetical protein